MVTAALYAKLDTLSGKPPRAEPGDEDGGSSDSSGSSENLIQMPWGDKVWPTVFASKGLNQNYTMKEQAAKINIKDNHRIKWYYKIIFEIWQMHGGKGEERGYSRDISDFTNAQKYNNHNLHQEYLCRVQNNNYDFEKAKRMKPLKTDGPPAHKTRSVTANANKTDEAEILRESFKNNTKRLENPSRDVTIKKETTFKPFIFENSNSDKEVENKDTCGGCSRITKEIAELKSTLASTEGKLVALSTVMERMGA